MCADIIQVLTIFIPFMATCLPQFPLRGRDTSEMYLDSWSVLKDTDQICLIQQGDGVFNTLSLALLALRFVTQEGGFKG